MSTQKKIVAETRSGQIEGSFEKDLYVFRGIPFAAPPTGERRWLPPLPHEPWRGVRKAFHFGTVAPQNILKSPVELPGFNEIEPSSEDCLFLNIWTPGLDNDRRPVMVWIHGGAFRIGSGSQSTYRGGSLASMGNVVLVSLNYRLGVLGFLNLIEVTGGKIPATGNEGLLDQIAALKWVRENIGAFGGDASNVTIFGESAGGMSVGCLMNMPGARGLFHKAILESAVGEMARPLAMSVNITREFLNIVGLATSDIAGLRALSVDRLLFAQQKLSLRKGHGMAPVTPVADGRVLPAMPLDSFEAGRAAKVPTLVGSNLEEQKLFSLMAPTPLKMDEETLIKISQSFVSTKHAATLVETYRKARANRGEPTDPAEIFSAINTDVMYRKIALRVAEAQCKHGQAAYNYLFTWKSPALGGALGACHGLEIGFVFGNRDAGFCGSGPEADKLAAQIQDAWLAFAKTGNPSCPSLGNWPQFCDQRQTMVFGRESHVEKSPYEEERQIWELIGEVKMGAMP